VPEILDHGVTGIVVDNVEEALTMLPQALALDRQRIRRCFEERFSVERMVSDYVALYDEVLRRDRVNARVLARTADRPSRAAA
jgi:hypothetical protein